MEIRVAGADQFFNLAADLRLAARRDLERELSAGLSRSVKPLTSAIAAESDRVMPRSGGYRAIMSRSLRFRITRAAAATSVRVHVSASGKGEERDVRRLNAGQLRHPNPPGRSRFVRGRGRVPNDWSVTRIRAGFVYRPFDANGPIVVKELGVAIDNVARKIAGG